MQNNSKFKSSYVGGSMNTIYVSEGGKKKYESSKEFALQCIDIYRRENDIEAEYEFSYKDSGAPELKVKAGDKPVSELRKSQELFISVSHSKDYLVVAIGKEEIGVDIEVIRNIKYMGIAEKFFNEEEAMDVSKNGIKRFFEYWVRYEAAHKRYGIGIFAGHKVGIEGAKLLEAGEGICLAVACSGSCELIFV